MPKEDDFFFAFQAGAIHGWSNNETLTGKEIRERFDKWYRDFLANKKKRKRSTPSKG